MPLRLYVAELRHIGRDVQELVHLLGQHTVHEVFAGQEVREIYLNLPLRHAVEEDAVHHLASHGGLTLQRFGNYQGAFAPLLRSAAVTAEDKEEVLNDVGEMACKGVIAHHGTLEMVLCQRLVAVQLLMYGGNEAVSRHIGVECGGHCAVAEVIVKVYGMVECHQSVELRVAVLPDVTVQELAKIRHIDTQLIVEDILHGILHQRHKGVVVEKQQQ